MALVDVGDHPRPERERLGVRVVDPERADAVPDPVLEHVPARLPQRDAVGLLRGPELDRVDVLVHLRRVLGVADRSVRPPLEPLGVVAHPGVVGAALERVVEGDLEAELGGARHEGVEVVDGAEVGVHGVVAALGGADGPRAAGVVGPASSVLLRPFRWVVPMGWIGGRYTTSKPRSAT